MSHPGRITVEFFGVPRLRAGCTEVSLIAETVGDALKEIAAKYPGLGDIMRNGRLAPSYLLSINGRRFDAALRTKLAPSDRLLLLSADAGG